MPKKSDRMPCLVFFFPFFPQRKPAKLGVAAPMPFHFCLFSSFLFLLSFPLFLIRLPLEGACSRYEVFALLELALWIAD